MKRTATGICVIMLLTGCATPNQYLNETNSVDVTGAYQLTDRDVFEAIDLGNLLCQYAPQGDPKKCGSVDKPASNADNANGLQADAATIPASTSKQLDTALHYYNVQVQQISDPQQKKSSRNALQERLLAASAQRCNAYKGNLQRTFSRTNFGLGVLATVAGTAGALVNSASAASNWSGLSAISSGSRAEFNQDFMSNLAAYVIVDGIDKRRQTIYEQIQTRGQAKNYEAYPVEAAIKDALYYHGQCSVIAGFQEASDSIKTSKEPGTDAAITALAKIKAASLMMHGDEKSPEAILATASKITGTTPLVAGTVLGASPGPEATFDEFLSAVADIQSSNAKLKATLAEMTATATGRKLPLDKLGLDKAEITMKIDDDVRKACVKKIAKYSSDEYEATTNAEVELVVSTKGVQLADAALSRARKSEVVAAAKELAEDYRVKANKSISGWREAFEKAKDADVDKMEVFRKRLADKPTLDDTLKGKLTNLCQ